MPKIFTPENRKGCCPHGRRNTSAVILAALPSPLPQLINMTAIWLLSTTTGTKMKNICKIFLPDYKVSKVLLDSTHDAMPYYQYFKRENITPFIDLNGKGGRQENRLYLRNTLL